MALYKVGDRLLSDEEYEEDCVAKWGLGLFILTALIAGMAVHSLIPSDWPKYIKLPIIILGGGIVGSIFAYFARHIRNLFFWLILFSVVGGISYGIWSVI